MHSSICMKKYCVKIEEVCSLAAGSSNIKRLLGLVECRLQQQRMVA